MLVFALNLRYLLNTLGRIALVVWAVFAVIICASGGVLWPFGVTITGGLWPALGAVFIGSPIFLYASFWILDTFIQTLFCPVDLGD